jgi:hypothetical protein
MAQGRLDEQVRISETPLEQIALPADGSQGASLSTLRRQGEEREVISLKNSRVSRQAPRPGACLDELRVSQEVPIVWEEFSSPIRVQDRISNKYPFSPFLYTEV